MGALLRHSYGMGLTLSDDYETAIAKVTEALKEEGFGIITTIDVKATLREKLGIEDFRRYVILGACNPQLAHRALSEETDIGLLLPCNVIVYETEEGTRVAAMDPLSALGLVENTHVRPIAEEANERLERALRRL